MTQNEGGNLEPTWYFVIISAASAILGSVIGSLITGYLTRKAAKEGANEAHKLLEKQERIKLNEHGKSCFLVLMSIVDSMRRRFNEAKRYTGQGKKNNAPLMSNDIPIELIPSIAHWNFQAAEKIIECNRIINYYNTFINAMNMDKPKNEEEWSGFYMGIQKYFTEFDSVFNELSTIKETNK